MDVLWERSPPKYMAHVLNVLVRKQTINANVRNMSCPAHCSLDDRRHFTNSNQKIGRGKSASVSGQKQTFPRQLYVRFTPKRHSGARLECPLWAKSPKADIEVVIFSASSSAWSARR
jgi:hypothetical protein